MLYIVRDFFPVMIGWIVDPIALSFTHGRKFTMVLPSTMRTTPLNYTLLYFIALQCTALKWNVHAQKSSGLHGVTVVRCARFELFLTSQQFTKLYYTALYLTALHCRDSPQGGDCRWGWLSDNWREYSDCIA